MILPYGVQLSCMGWNSQSVLEDPGPKYWGCSRRCLWARSWQAIKWGCPRNFLPFLWKLPPAQLGDCFSGSPTLLLWSKTDSRELWNLIHGANYCGRCGIGETPQRCNNLPALSAARPASLENEKVNNPHNQGFYTKHLQVFQLSLCESAHSLTWRLKSLALQMRHLRGKLQEWSIAWWNCDVQTQAKTIPNSLVWCAALQKEERDCT